MTINDFVNIVSRLFVCLICSGSKFNCLSFQTYIPFLLFYNHCDKSNRFHFINECIGVCVCAIT